MIMVRKSFAVKDVNTGDGAGMFRALVSTFGTKDSQNEVIEKGAFTDSLANGDVPILWDHQWDDIWSHIGSAKAAETDGGLVVDANLDLDNPTAAQAFKLLKSGRVKEFSIGGFEDPADVTTDDDGTRHVSKFDLREVSLTLAGANPETQLLEVKTLGGGTVFMNSGIVIPDGMHFEPIGKAGKVLAAKHVATLRDIHKRLGDLLKDVDPPTDDSKASPPNLDGKNHEPSTDVGGSSMSERRAAAFDQIKAAEAGKGQK
jgi:HK97 family phage prohead protease